MPSWRPGPDTYDRHRDNRGLKTDEFCDSLFKFIDLVEKAYRQKPLLYTYTNFYNKHLQGKIDNYCLMIAQYSDEEPKLADGRDYTLWQYTAKDA